MTMLVFTHRLIILIVSVKSDAKFRCIRKQAHVVFSQKLEESERLHHMCRLVKDVYHRSQSDDVTASTKDCDDSMASWHLMKIVTMKEVRGGS